eukprot:2870792-Pyramimonas_sp.AAC.1
MHLSRPKPTSQRHQILLNNLPRTAHNGVNLACARQKEVFGAPGPCWRDQCADALPWRATPRQGNH